MSENLDNTNSDTPLEATTEEQSLDEFEAEFFFGDQAPANEPVVEETVEESETDPVEETNEDEKPVEETEETEIEETEETSVEEETEEEEDTPKKETRAEKRIRELNAKYREEQRKRLEAERLLQEKEQNKSTETEEQPTPETKSNQNRAPHWDDVDEKGDPKYPMGQFDPNFNSDLVRYTIQEEQRKIQETETERRKLDADQQLQAAWEEKLAPAQERYPDFQEKGQELIEDLAYLEPNYAKYLTDTIRAIDNGPDVLYYLASNPDLAREIVDQGPALASVALGRISAQFGETRPKEKTPTRTKVTKAPAPPPTVRGSAPPKTKDLDNLDDFEEIFFQKK